MTQQIDIQNDTETVIVQQEEKLTFLKQKVYLLSQRYEARRTQAEMCAKLIDAIFKKDNFMYIYSLVNEVNSWLDNFMHMVEKNNRFTIKYQMIDVYKRDNMFKTNKVKKTDMLKTTTRKKLDVIILYIENIMEAEIILKSWTKNHGSHNDEDYIFFITKESSKSYSEKIMRRMWEYFSIFNVFIVDIGDMSHNFNATVMFTAHNPYSERAKFEGDILDETNIEEKCTEIVKFIKMRVHNLQGYPLRVTISDYTGLSGPIWDKEKKLIGFGGVEGKVVAEYAKIMNYTPIYVLPKEKNANPSSVSAKSDLVEVDGINADLYGNYRIVLYDTDMKVKFLQSLEQTRIVIVVPTSSPKSKTIGTILEVLNFSSRIVAIAFLLFIVTLWTLIRVKKSKGKVGIWSNLIIVLMNCTRIVHFSAIIMPRSAQEKAIYIILALWVFFIGNSFTAKIVSSLATTTTEHVNTYEDLIDTDLMIGSMVSTQDALIKGFENVTNADVVARNELYKRQFLISSPGDTILNVAYNRTCAIICPDYVSRAYTNEFYSKIDGRDLLYEMEEAVSTLYCAQMVPKTSPLAAAFEYAQDMFYQAGLMKYWAGMEDHRLMIRKMHRPNGPSTTYRELNLGNLSFTFTVWILMLTASFIVLLIEILVSEAIDDKYISKYTK
ncbi:uncharacterized protein LOC143920138 [Arctopsyche grandis]|uniref:uncharacterized protein LOC143920138 n=1 Tax=Arctopsyche grandis TaxID=121162 RepID=UPI00406D968C